MRRAVSVDTNVGTWRLCAETFWKIRSPVASVVHSIVGFDTQALLAYMSCSASIADSKFYTSMALDRYPLAMTAGQVIDVIETGHVRRSSAKVHKALMMPQTRTEHEDSSVERYPASRKWGPRISVYSDLAILRTVIESATIGDSRTNCVDSLH